MERRTVAVFDFDGTLTTRDTLLEFVRHTHGTLALYGGLLLLSPVLVLMKLGLYHNGRAKERFFAHFYKGWRYDDFRAAGEAFADIVDGFRREEVLTSLESHCEHGDEVVVVSASIVEWVAPWCLRNGVDKVIATRVATDRGGRLTGRFAGSNCYGREKVNRLLAMLPDREDYILYAYGDSNGDRELLSLADYPCKV